MSDAAPSAPATPAGAPPAPSPLATAEPWDLVLETNAPLVLIKNRVGPQRWAEVAPVIEERVRQSVGDGPVIVGRGAYFGIGRT